ncbi:MAG TPA: phosphate-starvation-inducible PsiE family protein [Myxococcota bacterium]|nr:phosphate-starvation-inducible PsiE family protein [Myxococcota bacterium]
MSESTDSKSRDRLSQWLIYAEDGIYLTVGVLLAATSIVIVFSTLQLFIEATRSGGILARSVEILDAMLLVLLIVEIMHTIRVSIVEHSLLAEPFLVVALIAGVRRMLILLVEASEFLPSQPRQFERVLLEMAVLIGFFVVIVGSIGFLKRIGRAPSETR